MLTLSPKFRNFALVMNHQSQRLESLDALRGLDLFLLLFLQPVMVTIAGVYSAPWYQAIMHQLDHEVWEGFRLWDLIMPLFLFMTGAAMPFSFAKYADRQKSRSTLYRRILRRVFLLFILGMIVQGNLLSLNFSYFQFYSNTLQAIAAGYLIAAIILLNLPTSGQIIATVALMAIYSIPMAINGNYQPDNSFAFHIDQYILGSHHGDLSYTWVWSSLTFGATVMLGAFAGAMMRNKCSAHQLALIAIALIAAGLLLGLVEPIIKRLWTSSMTLFSGGLCFLLMAIFYWWIDIRNHRRGITWLKVYGMNAILAYMLGEVINFRSIVNSLTFGLRPILNDWYPVILTFGNSLILYIILYQLYKNKIYLKV